MKRILAIAVVAVSMSACCDREITPLQQHWLRVGDGFLMLLDNVRRSDEQVDIAGRSVIHAWFSDLGVVGDISSQDYGFWLELTNNTSTPVRLLWPDAQYVDEFGRAHGIYHYSNSVEPPNDVQAPQPPTVIPPGVLQKEIIAPGYKTYMVGSCREAYVFREPLVPTNLSDLRRFPHDASVKAYVDDVAKRQVPVRLILPVEIEGKRYDYTFTFVLRDRTAAQPEE